MSMPLEPIALDEIKEIPTKESLIESASTIKAGEVYDNIAFLTPELAVLIRVIKESTSSIVRAVDATQADVIKVAAASVKGANQMMAFASPAPPPSRVPVGLGAFLLGLIGAGSLAPQLAPLVDALIAALVR